MSADVRTEQLAADLARRDAQLAAALELADAAVVEVGRALLSWENDAASARATLASCDRARAGAESEVDQLRALLMDLVSHHGSTGVGPLWEGARKLLEGRGAVYPPGFWGQLALRLLGQRDTEHARVVELERGLSVERAKVARFEKSRFDGMGKCDYCKGVGACPRCWGRSAVEALYVELAAERAKVEKLETALLAIVGGLQSDDEDFGAQIPDIAMAALTEVAP